MRERGSGAPGTPGPRVPSLRRNRMGLVGIGLLLAQVMAALLAPTLAPHPPLDQDTTRA